MLKVFKLSFIMLALFIFSGCSDTSKINVEEDIEDVSLRINDEVKEQVKSEIDEIVLDSSKEKEKVINKSNRKLTNLNNKLGDSVDLNGLTITLKNFRLSSGDEYLSPSKGKFIIVDISVENNTAELVNISSLLQTSISDNEGYNYNPTVSHETKGSLDGEIGIGRKIVGEVAFDVEDSSKYEFIFEDPFTKGQVIWEFEAK